ncbi:MAG: SUF system NifU family Fe-S cluster assembly protein [Euryarchaeota archaeon RBG_16_68_12]|nr:MAG: SUF system NifU family Fe-S cluster assembly protein [Euryarchaeota archaeon RBG_16_68_12]
MPDLKELYQEVILDHSKSPRNFHKLADANRKAVGRNPLCGDQFTVYLRVEDGRIADIAFEGQGCAISKSSASMMTMAVKGRTAAEAEDLFDRFHALVTGKKGAAEAPDLGKLAAFQGVSGFPVRVKCASLAWHTLKAALEEKEASISIE